MNKEHCTFIIKETIRYCLATFSIKKLGSIHAIVLGGTGLLLLGQSRIVNPLVSQNFVSIEKTYRTVLGLDPIENESFITQTETTQLSNTPGHYYVKYRNDSQGLIPKKLFEDFDRNKQSKEEYIQQLREKRGLAENILQQKNMKNITTTASIVEQTSEKIEDILDKHEVNEFSRVFKYMDSVDGEGDDMLNNIYYLNIENESNKDLLLQELSKDLNIEYIVPIPHYSIFNTNDPKFTNQWYLGGGNGIQAEKAWTQIPTGTQPSVIGIIDCGFESTHSDLTSNVLLNDGKSCEHGTHVAGIASAATNNSNGIAGVAFNMSKLKLYGDLENVGANIDRAIADGVKVINMSFGCCPGCSGIDNCPSSQCNNPPYDTKSSYDAACNDPIMAQAIAQGISAGVTMIAAAGNAKSSFVSIPASYPGVIAVGASDEGGNKATFSQYGNGIDVFAPGTNIYSTWIGNDYQSIPGTSMASPIVAGLAGLLKAIKPSLTPSEIEVILKSTATSMGDTSLYGAGRVNACKAVAQALGNDPNTICSTDGSTTTKKYACSGTSCVESATGNYSTSSCDNMCGKTDGGDGSIKKTYLCKETQCVEDFSGNGTFTEPSCGGTCSSSLPQPSKNTYSCENNQCTLKTDGSGKYTEASCGGTCTATTPSKKYSCSGTSCIESETGRFTTSNCDNMCSNNNPTQKYTCSGTSCIPSSTGSYTTSNCDNMCSNGGSTQSCNYLCLTPSTIQTQPQNALMSAAQTCTVPSASSDQCAGSTCAGVCEDGSKRCVDNSQCNGLTCKMRDQLQEKPCGGIAKYKCAAGACMRDDINGTMTHPSCNNACLGGAGYECAGSIDKNGLDCKDGPLPNNAATSYYGAKFCSPFKACDRVCQPGFTLDGNRCLLPDGSTGSGGNTDGNCSPSGLEKDFCGDQKDNDCDGFRDCLDTDCIGSSYCPGTGTGGNNGGSTIGNGKIDGNEQCDDGNLVNNDGCSASGTIEAGWSCTTDQPSQCGSLDCFTHGQYYSSNNIYGTCCSGLTGSVVALSSDPNAQKAITICYDPMIDEPLCLQTSGKTEGWYLKIHEDAAPELVVAGTCLVAYQDYYAMLSAELKDQQDFCAYDDINYDKVQFKDIAKHREKASIEALQNFCIIKGRGSYLNSFAPNSRSSRAEFIKMLIKTIYAGQMEFDESASNLPEDVSSPYLDVGAKSRYYPYIIQAHADGLLQKIDTKAFLSEFFYPNRSISSQEVIDMMLLVTDGQELSAESMMEIFENNKYPTRGQLATLIVRKFMPSFASYFYMQGKQQVYYKELLAELRGKKYVEQYNILTQQLGKLQNEEKTHGSADSTNNVNYFWMQQFLKNLFLKKSN